MMNLPDPAADVLCRLSGMGDVCGSEPPPTLYDQDGEVCGKPGDCWYTKDEGHDGLCACEICQARYGAPGWSAS